MKFFYLSWKWEVAYFLAVVAGMLAVLYGVDRYLMWLAWIGGVWLSVTGYQYGIKTGEARAKYYANLFGGLYQ